MEFLGDTLKRITAFPENARRAAGFQIRRLQQGLQPLDYKPMPTIGKGVEEIRIRDEEGAYRIIYIARLADAVYILHAFQKKTQATSNADLALAKARLHTLTGEKG